MFGMAGILGEFAVPRFRMVQRRQRLRSYLSIVDDGQELCVACMLVFTLPSG